MHKFWMNLWIIHSYFITLIYSILDIVIHYISSSNLINIWIHFGDDLYKVFRKNSNFSIQFAFPPSLVFNTFGQNLYNLQMKLKLHELRRESHSIGQYLPDLLLN